MAGIAGATTFALAAPGSAKSIDAAKRECAYWPMAIYRANLLCSEFVDKHCSASRLHCPRSDVDRCVAMGMLCRCAGATRANRRCAMPQRSLARMDAAWTQG